MSARIEIGPVELLALKKLALVNGALVKSINSASARVELAALLGVLMDVVSRADLANNMKKE